MASSPAGLSPPCDLSPGIALRARRSLSVRANAYATSARRLSEIRDECSAAFRCGLPARLHPGAGRRTGPDPFRSSDKTGVVGSAVQATGLRASGFRRDVLVDRLVRRVDVPANRSAVPRGPATRPPIHLLRRLSPLHRDPAIRGRPGRPGARSGRAAGRISGVCRFRGGPSLRLRLSRDQFPDRSRARSPDGPGNLGFLLAGPGTILAPFRRGVRHRGRSAAVLDLDDRARSIGFARNWTWSGGPSFRG